MQKQNKLLYEIKTVKEVVAELKDIITSNNCDVANVANVRTFKATNPKHVDGRKLFVESLEELLDFEEALKDELFFQRAVRFTYTVTVPLM